MFIKVDRGNLFTVKPRKKTSILDWIKYQNHLSTKTLCSVPWVVLKSSIIVHCFINLLQIQRMVISGGNFRTDILKPKEVVSLLLDDDDMERKRKKPFFTNGTRLTIKFQLFQTTCMHMYRKALSLCQFSSWNVYLNTINTFLFNWLWYVFPL